MQIKSIAMIVIAGCAIGMLTGCGVPQEEHDAIVAQLTSEKETAVNELQTKLDDTTSLLNAEQARTSSLNSDLRDSTVLNDELKQANDELKATIEDANGQISTLESQLATARASIRTAQDRATAAENGRSQAEMETRNTERRFNELILNLINLNKIKPSDVGWPELDAAAGVSEPADSMDFGGGDSDASAASLLDAMGDM
jgi:hypothetical protein